MLKGFLKGAAITCAVAITCSLCGCADTSWVVKDGSVTIPSGVYLFWLTQVAQSVTSNTSSGVDAWTQTISNTPAVTYATNNALSYTKQCAEIEKLCAEQKITSTSSELSSADTFASSEITANSTIYTGNGISQASLKRVYEDFVILRPKLFTAIYGPSGSQAVSDTDLKKYYASNYVRIKHIVILTNDSSNNALTGTALTTANNKATEAYNAAIKKGANFDTIMTKYTEDVDANKKPNEPTGYIFSESSASNNGFDSTFISSAFSMKVGEVKKVQASYGWDIMLKMKVDENYTWFTTNRTSILGEMKTTDFTAYLNDKISKDSLKQNDAAVNYYNPKNLKS